MSSNTKLKLCKIDKHITRIFKYVSYFSGAFLFLMAIFATVNVIYVKLFSKSIPSASDYVTYFMVPVVYLSVGFSLLDMGLVVADVLSRKFPRALVLIINSISYLLGAAASALIAWRQFDLMLNYYAINKRSSMVVLNFPLWPFCLVLSFGMVLLTLGFIWVIIRDSAGIKTAAKKDGEEQLTEGEGVN